MEKSKTVNESFDLYEKLEKLKKLSKNLEEKYMFNIKQISLSKMKRTIVDEYTKYKYNNSYVYGLFIFSFLIFSLTEFYNIPLLESSVVGLLSSSSVSIVSDLILKKRGEKIKKKYLEKYPEISMNDNDFDNFNFIDSYNFEKELCVSNDEIVEKIRKLEEEYNSCYGIYEGILKEQGMKEENINYEDSLGFHYDINTNGEVCKEKVKTLIKRK